MIHNFEEMLAFTKGIRQSTDLLTIQGLIPGCVQVIKTDEGTDRKGIDYVAFLRGGAQILIDGKARKPGAKRFWKYGEPELAIEVWSVRPGGKYRKPIGQAKTGWTLCQKSNRDYIYYSWDVNDTNRVFLVPFQLLRIATIAFFEKWNQVYGIKVNDSHTWESESMFIPWSEVDSAMSFVEQGVTRDVNGNPLLFDQWIE